MVDRTVLTRLKMDVSDYVRGAATAAAATKGLLNEVDTTNDRAAWMAQSFLAIGPALVPITSAAVPALAGLTTQMTIAGVGAGVAALAFVGLGQGLKALNDYQLDPSTAHLKKLRAELDKLGPSGAEFIQYLDSIGSELSTLRNAARDGIFPGAEAGIDALLDRLPQLRSIVSSVADGIGEILADGGKGLAGGRFDDFFNFLETDARSFLVDMGHTLGSFVDGFAALMVDFAPLSREFSGGLRNMAADFANWAHGLDSSSSFAAFLDYIHDAIPDVKDFAGSLTDAFVALAHAAAPVGDVMLPLLTELLDAFSTIIDTPLGSVFLGLAAAISIYGRAQALATITTGKMARNLFPATQAMIAQRAEIGASVGALGTYTAALLRADAAQARVWGPAMRAAIGSTLGQIAKGALPAVGALGLMLTMFTDIDEKAGLTNTAMFGFTGMMAGPWGAAIGAGVGLAMDFAAANNDVTDAIDRANQALEQSPTAFQQNAAAIADATAKVEAFRANAEDGNFWDGLGKGLTLNKGAIQNAFEEIFGTSEVDEQRAHVDELVDTYNRQVQAVSDLQNLLRDDGTIRDYTTDLDQLQQVAERMQPAMDHFGITMDDLANADPRLLQIYAQAMRDWVHEAESVPGRTQGVVDALQEIQDDSILAADSADTLAAALQALFGPELDAEEATDKWRVALRKLSGELKDIQDPFDGFNAKAVQNREVTRAAFQDTLDALTKQAEAGASAGQISRMILRTRDSFIQEGVAAGISADEMKRRANELGLTPKLVKTVFETVGLDLAEARARGLVNQIEKMPKEVQTKLSAAGYEVTKAQIDDLKKRYDLTPEQVETILRASDHASAVIDEVERRRENLDGSHAQVNLDAHAETASAEAALNQVARDRYSTIYTNVRRMGGAQDQAADGGVFDRRGGGLTRTFASGGFAGRIGDQWPQIRPFTGPRGITWSEEGSGPWEAFISGHPAKVARSRSIAAEVVSRLGGHAAFAGGGVLSRDVRPMPAGGGGGWGSTSVTVGGPRVQVFIDGREVRGIVRVENAKQQTWESALNDRDYTHE